MRSYRLARLTAQLGRQAFIPNHCLFAYPARFSTALAVESNNLDLAQSEISENVTNQEQDPEPARSLIQDELPTSEPDTPPREPTLSEKLREVFKDIRDEAEDAPKSASSVRPIHEARRQILDATTPNAVMDIIKELRQDYGQLERIYATAIRRVSELKSCRMAERLFIMAREDNPVSLPGTIYNTMIQAYATIKAQRGMPQVLVLMNEMDEKDIEVLNATYLSCLQTCIRDKDFENGKTIWERALRHANTFNNDLWDAGFDLRLVSSDLNGVLEDVKILDKCHFDLNTKKYVKIFKICGDVQPPARNVVNEFLARAFKAFSPQFPHVYIFQGLTNFYAKIGDAESCAQVIRMLANNRDKYSHSKFDSDLGSMFNMLLTIPKNLVSAQTHSIDEVESLFQFIDNTLARMKEMKAPLDDVTAHTILNYFALSEVADLMEPTEFAQKMKYYMDYVLDEDVSLDAQTSRRLFERYLKLLDGCAGLDESESFEALERVENYCETHNLAKTSKMKELAKRRNHTNAVPIGEVVESKEEDKEKTLLEVLGIDDDSDSDSNSDSDSDGSSGTDEAE